MKTMQPALSLRLNSVTSNLQETVYLLLIFLLPTQLGKHFWPEFASVAGLRVDYLAPTLYLTDILLILLAVSALTTLCFKHSKNRNLDSSLWIISFFVLWIGVLVIGVFASVRPELGLYGLLKFVEFTLFSIFTMFTVKRKGMMEKVVLVFAAGILFQSLLAIAQFYNQGSLGGLFYYAGERSFTSLTPGIANTSLAGRLVLRSYGTLPHPNVLAGYLLAGLILILSSLKRSSSSLKKLFLIFSVTVGFVGLLVSMSRWALVVGAVILLYECIYVVIKSRNYLMFKKWKGVILLVVNAGIAGWLMIAATIFALFLATLIFIPVYPRYFTFDVSDNSVVERRELALAAWKMFVDHPLLGVGVKQFLVHLPKYGFLHHGLVLLQPAHNIYLLLAAETGLAGVSFFLALVYLGIRKLKDKHDFVPGALILMIALLILGLNDHYLLTLQQGQLLLAFAAGLFFASKFNTLGLGRGKIKRKSKLVN